MFLIMKVKADGFSLFGTPVLFIYYIKNVSGMDFPNLFFAKL